MRFDGKPFVLALCLCSVGCADFHRGPAPRDAGADVAGDAGLVADWTFEVDVYPILESYCEGCHQEGGMAGSTRFLLTGNARLDRAMVVALVTPGDPEASLLLQRATGESHTGGQVIAQDGTDYGTIANWILSLPAQ